MATDTATPLGRQSHNQQIHYLRKAVAYNTTGIGTADTVKMPNQIPAGARICYTMVYIDTVFNAATTNVLTVGQTSGDNDVVAAGDVDETATGATMVLRGANLTFSAPTELYVRYTQTGTAATTGAAVIVIAYVPNNDG